MLSGDGVVNTLAGGDGDDQLQGAGGADVLDGGAGDDTAVYSGSFAGVNVNLATGTLGRVAMRRETVWPISKIS